MAKTRRGAPRTYTLEEKIALVREIERRLSAGGISVSAAATAAGTTFTSYRKWTQAGIRPAPLPEPPAASHVRTPDERAELLAQVDQKRAEGLGILAACKAVGISDKSYRKWQEDLAPPPAMRPVEVTALVPVAPTALTLAPPRSAAVLVLPAPAAASPPTPALTLVAPGGYRIEGLAVETAAQLLRALA